MGDIFTDGEKSYRRELLHDQLKKEHKELGEKLVQEACEKEKAAYDKACLTDPAAFVLEAQKLAKRVLGHASVRVTLLLSPQGIASWEAAVIPTAKRADAEEYRHAGRLGEGPAETFGPHPG
jgi:hypothetical protein